MSATVQIGGHSTGFGTTLRQERWWVGPLLTVAGILAFLVYSTWAAFEGAHYYASPYCRQCMSR